MRSYLAEHRFAIHVGLTDHVLETVETECRAAGMSVIRLDLAGLSGATALAEYLATAFMFPHATRGLDAAVDLMSDLDWIGNSNGFLVVVDGLDDAPNIVEPLAGILPNIVDRWRSQAVPFVIAILTMSYELTSALAAANRAMDNAGRLPWAQPGTGSVDVIAHKTLRAGRDL